MEPLYLERDLAAPAERVWRHLTTADGLTAWLCLRAWVDPEPGGRYELFWNPDESVPESDSTLGCRVLSIDAPRRLEVSWRGADEVAEVMNALDAPRTTVRFELTPRAGATRLRIEHVGWGEGEQWVAARTFFLRAWSAALQRLEGVVAAA